MGLLKFLNDYEGWFREKVGKNREHSFELSNVGMVDGLEKSKGEPSIKRMIFSQSSNVSGPALVFNVASARGGELAIALTWQEGIVPVESAEKVLDTLDLHVRKVAAM